MYFTSHLLNLLRHTCSSRSLDEGVGGASRGPAPARPVVVMEAPCRGSVNQVAQLAAAFLASATARVQPLRALSLPCMTCVRAFSTAVRTTPLFRPWYW